MNQIIELPLAELFPHPDNPRKDLGDLSDLAASIKESGLLQNLTVIEGRYLDEQEWAEMEDENERIAALTGGEYTALDFDPHNPIAPGYTVIIGHRRCEAARLAGLETVPCAVIEMDYKTQLATMLAENVQRADLTPIEQANGFQLMMDLGMSVSEVADKTGFSSNTVRRRLKIAGLDASLIQVNPAAISMKDLERVSNIKDEAVRTRLTESLGKRGFDFDIERAESEQRSRELREAIEKELAEKRPDLRNAQKIARGSIGRSVYNEYWLLKTINFERENITIPENALVYSIEVKDGGLNAQITFGGKNNKAEKESDPSYRAENKRQIGINILQWETINAAAKAAYERRFAFMRTILDNGRALISKHASELFENAGMIIYSQLGWDARRRFCNLFASDWDKVSYAEAKAVIQAATFNAAPEVLLAAMVYAETDPGVAAHYKNYGYSSSDKPAEFTRNPSLDGIYEWLSVIGYEKSGEELRIEDAGDKLYSHEYFEKLFDEKNAADRGGKGREGGAKT